MSGDDKLRRAFAELHRSTAKRAPQFRALWNRAQELRRRRPAPRFRFAAAATVAAAALAALLFFALPRPEGPGVQAGETALARDLSSWSAPLDFLLLTPGLELWGAPTDLGSALPGPEPDTLEEIL